MRAADRKTIKLVIECFERCKDAQITAKAAGISLFQCKLILKKAKLLDADSYDVPTAKNKLYVKERLARNTDNPLELAKAVLGKRFDQLTLKLDGRISRIDNIILEANKINYHLGAEQIKGKDCWIYYAAES